MADTHRTLTALLTTIFQDGQANGSISAQDERDLLVSLAPQFAAFQMEDNATGTSLTLQNSWYKVAGTTASLITARGISLPESNRFTYDEAPNRTALLSASFSMTCSVSNQTIELAWAKNGSPVLGKIARKIGTGGDVGAAGIVSAILMAQNDYAELFARNITSAGTTLTITDMSATVLATI